MKKSMMLVLATLLFASLCSGQVRSEFANENSHGYIEGEWPQYGFNSWHSGFNPFEVQLNSSNVATLELAWEAYLYCPVYTAPAIWRGLIVVGSYCNPGVNDVYAYDALSGKLQWTFYAATYVVASPAISDGTVFVATKKYASVQRGNLYALSAKNGELLWSADIGVGIADGNAPTVANGIVYISGDKLYAFNQFGCGKAICPPLWEAFIADGIDDPLKARPVAVSRGIAYLGSMDGKLHAYDALTGASLWMVVLSFPHTGPNETGFSSPSVGRKLVYIASSDNRLYAIPAAGCGSSVCNPVWTALIGAGALGTGTIPSPAVANGMVFVGSPSKNRFFAFAEKGCGQSPCKPVWSAVMGSTVHTFPAVANGVVFAAGNDNVIYAMDAANGSVLWKKYLGPYQFWLGSSPAVSNGRLYVGNTFGYNVAAFRLPPNTD